MKGRGGQGARGTAAGKDRLLEACSKTEGEPLGIHLRPLEAEQVRGLCGLPLAPPRGEGEFLLGLLSERVSPGVGPGVHLRSNNAPPGRMAAEGYGDQEALRRPIHMGRLPPSEYLTAFKTRVAPRVDELYRPLVFDAAEV